MKQQTKLILAISAVLFLGACASDEADDAGGATSAEKKASLKSKRWYSAEQVETGARVFKENCASCHGDAAEGHPNWRQANAEGKYPPPPLNGTAHAWHHPKNVLRLTVKRGGIPLDGTMPPFGDKLSDEEIDAVIAWVQSHWNDEIYSAWAKRNAQVAMQRR